MKKIKTACLQFVFFYITCIYVAKIKSQLTTIGPHNKISGYIDMQFS